ncbi:MAG: hypothetical protein LBH54_01680 [Clostridiales bacterium]|jgi:hypothetical protein|nr:hypothetical protein [Clostridiales bacterium]
MRFRQVHLDFHTSEKVENIGEEFSKEQFQQALKEGHVDSITVFSKCHHGWAYHPSTANETHPHLKFDLLKSQIDAAHEIGVKTPVYLSAGFDEKIVERHPRWLVRSKEQMTEDAPQYDHPHYHRFCMNTPYLDVLIKQVEEVARNYDADGIFLDIVGENPCYCPTCLRDRIDGGGDPYDARNAWAHARQVYAAYTAGVNDAIRRIRPELPIFHNSGHIWRGRRELMRVDTHIETESLPTGGWGYDHFPMSARYIQPVCADMGMEFLGMTGKFHESWGEFGGFKHPNALLYETALDLANGAKCSVGDQLHPGGKMDAATYRLIGTAYASVEEKEPWCGNVTGVADVGLLSQESVFAAKQDGGAARSFVLDGDVGAVRILLEGHYLFDVIDLDFDFNKYKVIILPDSITVDGRLKEKLKDFRGKILASGLSGLDENQKFVPDLGAEYVGTSAYQPTYLSPEFTLKNLLPSCYIVYGAAQNVTPSGNTLGKLVDPYFNRTAREFCSHWHTPANPGDTHAGITAGKDGIYLCWDVFGDYAAKGSLAVKETVFWCLDRLLDGGKTVELQGFGAQGVTTVMEQSGENRYVHHLVYAAPVKRGRGVEVIEDIFPLYQIQAALRLPREIKNVSLAPQAERLDFTQEGGVVRYTVPVVDCHQMVVLEY